MIAAHGFGLRAHGRDKSKGTVVSFLDPSSSALRLRRSVGRSVGRLLGWLVGWLVWFGLVWFGLVWFGLVWFGLVLVCWLCVWWEMGGAGEEGGSEGSKGGQRSGVQGFCGRGEAEERGRRGVKRVMKLDVGLRLAGATAGPGAGAGIRVSTWCWVDCYG